MFFFHSFRHNTGIRQTDGQTDRFAITISRSACIACWRAIKMVFSVFAIYAITGLENSHCENHLSLVTSCAGSHAICPRPCTPHAAAQLQPIHALRLRRPARLAPWIFMIDRLWLWCRPYKLCSDLNSQPKRPGDLDLWPWKWCPSHVRRGLPLLQF